MTAPAPDEAPRAAARPPRRAAPMPASPEEAVAAALREVLAVAGDIDFLAGAFEATGNPRVSDRLERLSARLKQGARLAREAAGRIAQPALPLGGPPVAVKDKPDAG